MASNISIKIDVTKIKGAVIHKLGKDETKCIVIPVGFSGMYDGEKGIYLDLTAIPLKQLRDNSKDTHLVKQNFGTEAYKAMTDEEKNAVPIMGNAILWPDKDGSSATTQSTAKSTPNEVPDWLK